MAGYHSNTIKGPLIKREAAGHLPGEAGFWVFIFGDLMMFTLFFCIIMVTRGQQPEIFSDSQKALHLGCGLFNTLLLLVGSYFVALGMQFLKTETIDASSNGGRRSKSSVFLCALLCGALFLCIKLIEYVLAVNSGFLPTSNDFFMYYFIFTGIHLAHLLLGMAGLTALYFLSKKSQLSTGELRVAECCACYWHLVDMLWLVLFPLLYIVN